MPNSINGQNNFALIHGILSNDLKEKVNPKEHGEKKDSLPFKDEYNISNEILEKSKENVNFKIPSWMNAESKETVKHELKELSVEQYSIEEVIEYEEKDVGEGIFRKSRKKSIKKFLNLFKNEEEGEVNEKRQNKIEKKLEKLIEFFGLKPKEGLNEIIRNIFDDILNINENKNNLQEQEPFGIGGPAPQGNIAASNPQALSPQQADKAREGTVNAAKLLNKRMQEGSVKFEGNLDRQKYNPKFWDLKQENGKSFWAIKPGIKPSDAINDLFANNPQGTYSIDCASSANITMLKGKLDAMGAEQFDRQFSGLGIRGWETATGFDGNRKWDIDGAIDKLQGNRDQLGGGTANLKPGDLVYFTNPNVAAGSSPDQGENAIFMGNDANGQPIFFGNPVGIFSGTQCEYGTLSTLRGSVG